MARPLVVEGERRLPRGRSRRRRRRTDRNSSGGARCRTRRSRARGCADKSGCSGCDPKACLMSVSSSSWCCCSWWRPEAIVDAMAGVWASLRSPACRCIACVDVAAIRVDLVERRARELPAARPVGPRPDPFVVRVEEELEGRVERPVAGGVRLQHERLEEPGRVGEVPLGRARVRHRLHQLILGRERRRQRQRARADRAVLVEEAHEDRGGPKGSARLVSPSCSRPWSAPPRCSPS